MDPDPVSLLSIPSILNALLALSPVGVYAMAFILLLAVSFFVSGAEAAFFSLTRAELATFREDKSFLGQRIYQMMRREKRLLATILIANNLVNVGAILVATQMLSQLKESLPNSAAMNWILEILLITGVILLFGEIVPKVFATKNRIKYVRALARPLDFLMQIFAWPSKALIALNKTLERALSRRISTQEANASLEDLRHAINLTATQEEDKEEKELLKGIVNFSNIPVKSIMQARVDVKAIDISTPFEELLQFIQEHNYSRLPVYRDNLDHVAGILHIKDLLPCLQKKPAEVDLEKFLREIHYVPEMKKIDTLLEEFKARRSHMAVVVDEFGGTAGIVTLEDVIEEIFVEFGDEFDSESTTISKISENTYIFEGKLSLMDLKRMLELEDEAFEDARGDNDTLGGLILELHRKIPERGDTVWYNNFELIVESVSKNRIVQVKFVIHKTEQVQEAEK
ncbi:MAG: gliding motility-associated protein GldE [Bacteroidota bacterium]